MGSILKLENNWEFVPDAVDAGLVHQWFKRKPPGTRKIRLPHTWCAETNEEKAHIAYYFNSFTVDKKESPKRFFIRFQSVLQHATVWLNGEELGTHTGGHVRFDLDASRAVKVGEENLLAVRVQTLDRQGKIGDQAAAELPLGAVFAKHPYAGLLGGVELLMAGKAGIRSLVCFPDYEADRVTIETKFWNPKGFQAEISYTLTNPDGESGALAKNVKLEKENATLTFTLQLDQVKLWHVQDPNLYRLKAALTGSYEVETAFGMRAVDAEKGVIKLNHLPLKARGVAYPWLFPFLGGQPPFDFDLRKDLQAVKEAGFNLIRSGGAPLPREVLDICDQIGLLVLQESPSYNQKSSKDGLEDLKALLQAMVEADGSHPCVFGWVVGSENGSMALENGNKLLRFVSELDATRPVFSNLDSVYMDSLGAGKIDLGKVFEPATNQIGPFESHKLRIGFPVSVRTYGMLANYCTSKDGKAVADGLHGSKSFWERYNYLKDDLDGKVLVDGIGIGCPEGIEDLLRDAKKYAACPDYKDLAGLRDELAKGLKDKGLGIWKQPEDFWREASALARQALAKQVEALLINTQVSGFILDAWADAGREFTGLVNWMRRPKGALDAMRKVNRPVHVIAEAEARTPYIGTSAAIKIHMVNEANLGDYGLLLRVKGPNGRIWHQESLPGRAKPGVNLVGRFKFPVGYEKGRFTFDLNLSKNNKEIGRTEEIFLVPPETKLDAYLKSTDLKGNFPDTISYASHPDAPVALVIEAASRTDAELNAGLQKAQQGGTLVLGNLNEEDCRKLNGLKGSGLPELRAFRSSGGHWASFHYAAAAPELKDLPANCVLDQTYADVLPYWSLDFLPQAKVAAASVNLQPPGAPQRLRWGMDLAHLPLGKGKVVLYQFDIFGKLGRNALADALFANLISALVK